MSDELIKSKQSMMPNSSSASFITSSSSPQNPTSILETKPFSSSSSSSSAPTESRQLNPIGLGLVHVLVDEEFSINVAPKLERRILLLGSQTRRSTRLPPPPEIMERSEDYTCVILHGPNPRTTHIFDDCVVEADHSLGCCCRCRRRISSREDVYMLRGDRAFCSDACREQEISAEEGKEKQQLEVVFGA